MLRKIIANLPYNPSLIYQVTFYAGRMKAEAGIRRFGLILMVFALFIQMFAVISPPRPTIANAANDIIDGGFETKEEAVDACRRNSQGDFANILANYKVSCDRLAASSTVTKTIKSTDYNKTLYSMGRQEQGPVIARTNKPTNEYAVSIEGKTYYMRHLWAWDSGEYSNYKVLSTTNSDGVTIMIMYACGNIITIDKYAPPTPPATPPPPKPKPPVIPHTPPPAEPEQNPIVGIRLASCDLETKKGMFHGFAFDGDRPANAIRVELYIDGERVNNYITTKLYQDVNDEYGLTGNHGFEINSTLNNKYFDGKQHSVYIVGIGVDKSGTRDGKNTQSETLTFGPCEQPDYCPNVPGAQASTKDCPKDVCPNVIGTQTSISECPTDACHLVDVLQTKKSECDVCPNISGEQSSKSMCKPCDEAQNENDQLVCLNYTKTARNITQNIENANGTTAQGGDIVEYTLGITNTGKSTFEKFVVEEDITDILQYSDITNLHGAKKPESGVLRWNPVDIKPGETVVKNLTIRIKKPIPDTPTSSSHPGSFDLTLTNVYHGQAVNILLPVSIVKATEQITTKTLPNTGPGSTLVITFSATLIVGYLLARSRLLAKEMSVLKQEYAGNV